MTAPLIPPIEPDYPRTAHVLHLLVSLLTFGLWLLPWMFITVANQGKYARMRDEYEYAHRAYYEALHQRG